MLHSLPYFRFLRPRWIRGTNLDSVLVQSGQRILIMPIPRLVAVLEFGNLGQGLVLVLVVPWVDHTVHLQLALGKVGSGRLGGANYQYILSTLESRHDRPINGKPVMRLFALIGPYTYKKYPATPRAAMTIALKGYKAGSRLANLFTLAVACWTCAVREMLCGSTYSSALS